MRLDGPQIRVRVTPSAAAAAACALAGPPGAWPAELGRDRAGESHALAGAFRDERVPAERSVTRAR